MRFGFEGEPGLGEEGVDEGGPVRYPVGLDPSPATASAYSVIAIPQTFLLSARHRIARQVSGL